MEPRQKDLLLFNTAHDYSQMDTVNYPGRRLLVPVEDGYMHNKSWYRAIVIKLDECEK